MNNKNVENDENLKSINKLKEAIETTDTIVIGAGAGLSTSAGFIYGGEKFKKYFFDLINIYGIKDMYTGAFCDYKTKEERWAFFSRVVYLNRYVDAPKKTYNKLMNIVKNKNYFVITTNVDHQFQKANFDKKRLFYTQGDYGLLQCSVPCKQETYDNEEIIYKMLENQGFVKNSEGIYDIDKKENIRSSIDSSLIPKCPSCGKDMTYNLRGDDKFVEDKGWDDGCKRYNDFCKKYCNNNEKVLYLELGVGYNTPSIIKYPFIQKTLYNKNAIYCIINYGEADIYEEIKERSIGINSDIDIVIDKILE